MSCHHETCMFFSFAAGSNLLATGLLGIKDTLVLGVLCQFGVGVEDISGDGEEFAIILT